MWVTRPGRVVHKRALVTLGHKSLPSACSGVGHKGIVQYAPVGGKCAASSTLAVLGSISFAGSPPVPCPAAGLQRWAKLPTSREIKGYVAEFREFLQEGTFLERKVPIPNFVTGIEIVEDEAVLA